MAKEARVSGVLQGLGVLEAGGLGGLMGFGALQGLGALEAGWLG